MMTMPLCMLAYDLAFCFLHSTVFDQVKAIANKLASGLPEMLAVSCD
jgi:hypothetical protein